MSVVISVRVPKKLKEEMDRLSGKVNWSEEIRRFLERRVEELRRRQALEKVRKMLMERPESPPGTAAALVREDRDSH